MKSLTVFIPARGGSRGVPNKNIKEFAGKPLIVHTIVYALESKLINENKDTLFLFALTI